MPEVFCVIGARGAEQILRDARDCLSELGVGTAAVFVDYRLFLNCKLILAV